VSSPPDLINLSIAGPSDPLLGRLIDKALQNGTIIVAAQPRSTTAEMAYPAGHTGVLAVSFGPASDGTILAPGEQIMVALPDNGYDFRSGSSLAAANASGVIALLLERQPGLGSARIADVLRHSQIADGQDREVINACRALAYIDVANECP
jgi:subtilisin family serine protease